MRRNIHNVISDALKHVAIDEDEVEVEFGVWGEVGGLIITRRNSEHWNFKQELKISISYEDEQADPTMCVDCNTLFSEITLNSFMEYLCNWPIEIG